MATLTSGSYLITASSSTGTASFTTSGTTALAFNDAIFGATNVRFVHTRHAQPGETIDLPDGSKLVVDAAGNYHIEDKRAKVTYRANRLREFNPFVNASDLLAEFVRDLGTIGLPNDAIMRAPIDLFIHWLVVRAAEQDGDRVAENHCRRCGRFVAVNRRRLGACRPDHVALLPPRKHVRTPRLRMGAA
jgi:hypothetical protein